MICSNLDEKYEFYIKLYRKEKTFYKYMFPLAQSNNLAYKCIFEYDIISKWDVLARGVCQKAKNKPKN